MARPAGLGYQPGIDGLRALAVTAVILYHAQQNMPSSWLPGGFLGVEVFFAISGYLITALILVEHERTGRIHVREFWIRRARRLLPALFALLIVTIAVVGIGGRSNDSLREHVADFRGMWLSAWAYVTNWYQIIAGLNYGDSVGRPPLLRHLWSLAVEEQFYVLWPLVMWGVLRRVRSRNGRNRVGLLFAVLAGIAALVTALVYQPANLGRVNILYLSTPTRATGLLLGAALALLWQPWRSADDLPARHGRVMDAIALAALAVLGWAFLRWHFTVEGATGTFGYDLLFRGGFLIIDVATLLLVVVAMHPASFVGRHLLGSAPLVWLGKRSYGLYLWHWPVFQLARPLGDQSLLDANRPDLRTSWLPALALRLLITVVLTELSYRFLEMPIRRGALGNWWRERGRRRGRRVLTTTAVCVPLLILVAVSSTMSFGAVDQLALDAACNEHPESCGDAPEPLVDSTVDIPTSLSTDTEGAGVADTVLADDTATAAIDTVANTSAAVGASTSSTVRRPRSTRPALAIGDSVMVGASGALQRAGVRVDAHISRSFAGALALVQRYRRQQQLGDIVIIGLGTAGGISADRVTKVMEVLRSVPHVVFITPEAGGRSFEKRSREILLQAEKDYPNVSIIDWQQLAQPYLKYNDGVPGVAFTDLYFYRDQIHVVSKGRRLFADLILNEIKRLSGP